MNLMGGRPIVAHTIQKLKPYASCIIIAAPEFDRQGLDFLIESDAVRIHYGQDESPLLRMVSAASGLDDDAYVLRVNALNFCVDMESAVEMLAIAVREECDVIRFPENFPSLFASDLYKLAALRRLAGMNPSPMFHVHPKYAMSEPNGFCSMVFEPPLDRFPDEVLRSVRDACFSSIFQTRIEVDRSLSIKAADSIIHHYEMVLPYLKPEEYVLDMACGSGFGATVIAQWGARVIGIDIDKKVLAASESNAHLGNLELISADCLNTGFTSSLFDSVTAFEIIEHVDPNALLKEISRVLKPGGRCFISTPQNVLGHIPTTPDHVREYSLSGLLDIVSSYFEVEVLIGIKQGTISFEGDPVGSNSFVVCKKL